ncbi:hypothetical protein ABK040_009583 [Willaertia magna]
MRSLCAFTKILNKTSHLIKSNLLQTLIPSLIKTSSSCGNYSSSLKKENFIFNTQLITNKFSIKNYSTTLISKNISETTANITLNPVQYKVWTSQQVCSLLCVTKGEGGAGLPVEKVKPLYAGFDGTLLGIIVYDLKVEKRDTRPFLEKRQQLTWLTRQYFPTFPLNLICDVVDWVDNLFQTRLYHLWSNEQIKEQLCKSVKLTLEEAEKLCHLSLTSLVNDINEFGLEKTLKQLEITQKNIALESLKYYLNWINNISKLTVPIIKAQSFIGPVFEFRQSIPYQNNENNILEVGQVLLNNMIFKQRKENERFQKLLVNFANFGFGKTRFGVQFLDLWKMYLEENLELKKSLIGRYGQELITKLTNTELIYIDVSQKSFSKESFEYLQNMVPKNDTSYFVVIDEYTTFCSSDKGGTILENMYKAWIDCIFSIQLLENVVGVCVCGKGAFLDLFDKSELLYKRPPTECFAVQLHCLDRDNLDELFTKVIPKVKTLLEEDGSYEFYLNEMLEETAGIPFLVTKVINLLLLNQDSYKSKKDFLTVFDLMQIDTPERILFPHYSSDERFSRNIYTFLMFISFIQPKLKLNMNFTKEHFNIREIEGLEQLKVVDLSTLAVALNCYITSVDDHHVKLIFPRRTIRKQVETNTSFSIQTFVKPIPKFLSKGDTFELLIDSFIIWKAKIGYYQSQTFSEMFPFLIDTKLKNKLCCDLIGKKILKENAFDNWKDIYNNFEKYKNKVNFLNSASFGSDKFICLEKDLWWCIQDKNKTEFNFTELFAEITNLKVLPLLDVHIVFTVFYRCKVNLTKKLYQGRDKIQRIDENSKSDNNIIEVPNNVTVVIVDKVEVEKFIDESNYKALVELSSVKPIFI